MLFTYYLYCNISIINVFSIFFVQPASAYNPPTVPEPMNAPVSEKYHWDHLEKNENRQFTYEELEKFTDNFQRLIGKGGFGCVYHGCLEDHTEVAVKIHSENSRHGLSEFLAEVLNSVDKEVEETLEYKFQHHMCDLHYKCFVPHYTGSELVKGPSQKSCFFGWLLHREGSFSIGL